MFTHSETTKDDLKFFSDDALKERKEKAKLKLLLYKYNPTAMSKENNPNKEPEIINVVSETEKFHRMLMLHNTKTEKNIRRYVDEHERKLALKEAG